MMRLTLTQLHKLKQTGEKITCLTAYDASFAYLMEQAGVEIILVGDSLGMVVQGHDSTLPVTVAQMVYHTQLVQRRTERAFLIADMPFMSYATISDALQNAACLMREGQAQMVKLEGGLWLVDTVRALVERGIPVCAHLGLTPQSVHQLGGYRVQGRGETAAQRVLAEAYALQQAGASLLVLECVPSQLAALISKELTIPTIGIGAGVECDGQVLVIYDMLGIHLTKPPSFVKNFLATTGSIQDAFAAYVAAVKTRQFPSAEHSFS
jgi:3-methyl-2-oxobutanoate hydroxymethyltransferase